MLLHIMYQKSISLKMVLLDKLKLLYKKATINNKIIT